MDKLDELLPLTVVALRPCGIAVPADVFREFEFVGLQTPNELPIVCGPVMKWISLIGFLEDFGESSALDPVFAGVGGLTTDPALGGAGG